MIDRRPFLIEIIECLADHGVEFIICGGMAAVYHGVERMTMDLDISLDMEKSNVERFLEAVKALNLTPRAPVPPESLLDPKAVDFFIREKHALVFTFWHTDSPYKQLDVFLPEDKSYHILKDYTVEVSVNNRIIKIISIEKLLEMKLAIDPLRDKDKFDIGALKKIVGKG